MTTHLSPPNDGVDQICYLIYGREDYDNHPAVIAYHRENNTWWANGRKGPRPIHWRQRVRDPWAGIVIYEDPEHNPTQKEGYRRHWLYEPALLQDLLINTPRIVRAIHNAVEQDYDMTSARRVYRDILSVIRNEFRASWEEWYNKHNSDSPLTIVSSGNIETAWKKALKYLESTAELIAGCLYQNYENDVHAWSVNIIKYGEPSDRWLQHLEKVARNSQQPKFERCPVTAAPLRSLVLDEGEELTNVPVKTPIFVEE